MADRAGAKSKAQAHGKSKKKGAMDGMTVKGGHKLSVKEGAGLTEKGRKSINRRTGSNLKAPQPEGGPRKKSFCARSRGWTGETWQSCTRPVEMLMSNKKKAQEFFQQKKEVAKEKCGCKHSKGKS